MAAHEVHEDEHVEAVVVEDEHGHEGESVMDTYLELLTDPAHWAFEVTGEATSTVVVALVLTPLIKRWVKRHDRTEHSTCTCTPTRSRVTTG